MPTVLIADNHPIFRQGLRQVIEELDGYTVIAEAADGETAIAQIELLEPDIVTVDLNMPALDGYQVADWVAANRPACRTVVISMHADKPFVAKARSSGARGFVAKEDAASDLKQAFESASPFFMSSSAGRPEVSFAAATGNGPPSTLLGVLTPTERRVLKFIAKAQTSRAIAGQLGISERTVHSHRNNICTKLCLRGANALLHFAAQNRDAIEADQAVPRTGQR